MDEELRNRERRGAQDPISALRHAHELDRLGDRDGAVRRLLPFRDDRQVRRRLSESPSWTHQSGDSGQSHAIDVPPIRSGATIRWIVRQRDAAQVIGLLATPLGVVVVEFLRKGVWRATALEPDDGSERFRRQITALPFIAGDFLLSWTRESCSAFDLLTGQLTHTIPMRGRRGTGDPHSLARLGAADLQVRPYLGADQGGARWSIPLASAFAFTPHDHDLVKLTRDIVLVQGGLTSLHGNILAFARQDGSLLWRTSGGFSLADADGVTLTLEASPGCSLLANDGAVRWTLHEVGLPVALLPRAVVAWTRGPGQGLIVIDRMTGTVRATLDSIKTLPIGAARDVFYAVTRDDCIVGIDSSGATLWTAPLRERHGAISHLAAYPDRVYGTCEDGKVFCLEGTVGAVSSP